MIWTTKAYAARTRISLILLAACALVSSLCSGTEYPELITDRPDQTESSTTVLYQICADRDGLAAFGKR